MAAALILSYIWRWHDITPGVQVLKISTVATALAWAFLLFRPRWPVLRRALSYPYVWLPLLWTAWILVGIPTALDGDGSWSFFTGNFLKTLAGFLFLLTFVSGLRQVRVLVGIHAIGASAVAFYYIKGGLPRTWSPISMYDPNDLALHLAIALPLALYFALDAPRGRGGLLRWAIVLMVGIAAIGSQSRGALLAVGTAVTYMLLTARAIPWRYRLLPPVALVVGLALAPDDVKERFATLGNLEEDYNTQAEDGRLQVWKRGLTYVGDRPLLGFGLDSFLATDRRFAPQADTNPYWGGKSAHNSLLQVAVESGVVGLALFLGSFLAAIARLVGIRRHYRRVGAGGARSPAVLADLLICSILIYLVGGFFLSQAYAVIPMTLLVMVAGLDAELETGRLRTR